MDRTVMYSSMGVCLCNDSIVWSCTLSLFVADHVLVYAGLALAYGFNNV